MRVQREIIYHRDKLSKVGVPINVFNVRFNPWTNSQVQAYFLLASTIDFCRWQLIYSLKINQTTSPVFFNFLGRSNSSKSMVKLGTRISKNVELEIHNTQIFKIRVWTRSNLHTPLMVYLDFGPSFFLDLSKIRVLICLVSHDLYIFARDTSKLGFGAGCATNLIHVRR